MESKNRLRLHKVIIIVILAAFAVGSAYLYITGDYFKANAGVVAILLILLPQFLYAKIKWLRQRYTYSFVRSVELLVACFLVANALGAIKLYYIGMEYDGIIHMIISGLTCYFATIIYSIYLYKKHGEIRRFSSMLGGVLFTIAVAVIGWEVFEILGDQAWGTIMSVEPDQPLDTWFDVAWDTIGILISCIIQYYTIEHFTHSFRQKNSKIIK